MATGAKLMTTSTLFTNNRSQAVRLPADLRYPSHVKKVEVRAVGLDRIIALPIRLGQFFINGPEVSDDFLSERADQGQSERESF